MASELASFYNDTRTARKLIVVDLGFLGDTVHLVPALWELRRNYPDAALHVLTTPVGSEVLRLVPCVDRAWAMELDPRKRTLRQQWQIVRALRRERFDVAYNFNGADRTLFMTALTGARWRVGHCVGRWHRWNPWLIPRWVPRQNRDLPVFEQRRRVLAACGLELQQTRFALRVPSEEERWAATSFEAGAAHFSVNAASTPLNEWPLTHWVELARRLLRDARFSTLIATGSARLRERQRLEALSSGVRDSRLRVLEPEPIPRLASILHRCRLHVGSDSGGLHLAVALGLPTISFFRERSGREWLPTGRSHRVFMAPCACLGGAAQTCASVGTAECLARISPQEVAQAVDEVLQAGSHDLQ